MFGPLERASAATCSGVSPFLAVVLQQYLEETQLSAMPKPAWFRELYGFEEGPSYSENQAKFSMDGDFLVCETSAFPRQYVGPFETPTLAELRSRVAEAGNASPDVGLKFSNLAMSEGVVPLILDPGNAGAVFQAASQFNCLEMTGPAVTPARGIAIYFNDPTQGPKCALSCPAGTVFRNYLCQNGKGQGEEQIDCLADVATVVDNAKHQFWRMSNGYALPGSTTAMAKLSKRFNSQEGLIDAAEAALRVGVHWETSVAPPAEHRVAQVYASALPVAYSAGIKAEAFEPFARLILRGAYEATLAVGQLKAAQLGKGSRATVFLTALGGGAFGNRIEWIYDALKGALDKYRNAPLDVKLVHYGSAVPPEWVTLDQLNAA